MFRLIVPEIVYTNEANPFRSHVNPSYGLVVSDSYFSVSFVFYSIEIMIVRRVYRNFSVQPPLLLLLRCVVLRCARVRICRLARHRMHGRSIGLVFGITKHEGKIRS